MPEPARTLGDVKRTAERYRIGFDFAKLLESGDTVQTGSVSAVDDLGAPAPTFITGAGVTGSSVRVTIQNGTAGRDYTVSFQATTTPGGDIFVREILVRVR